MVACLILAAFANSLFTGPGRRSNLPPIPRDFRGAWVATVANIDWPKLRGEPTSVAKAQMQQILDKAVELHLNAIVFQIRPSADALYDTKYEPWSEYLTGKQGQPPKPMWDPLEWTIHEAHRRGILVHGWFNPYRAESPSQKGPNAATHISHTHPEVVKRYGEFLWMDPGEKIVQQQSLNVILDVVKRYDIDGIHMDDYFYPYKIKDANNKVVDFPDSVSWGKYQRSGGKLSRDDWRRENVDHFIQSVYSGIKHIKPWVLFGVSPFGIYRPGMPAGIKAGVDQYADLYADPLKWLHKGWCDYISPQLYWPIHQTAQSYPALLNWWSSENTLHRHFWPGMYTSLVSSSPKSWPVSEILNQIRLNLGTHHELQTQFANDKAITDKESGASGEIHFSFTVFQQDPKNIDAALLGGPYSLPAVPPDSPWLETGPGPKVLEAKRIGTRGSASGSDEFSLEAEGNIRFYGISRFIDGKWSNWEFSGDKIALRALGEELAIIAIDKYLRISNPLIINPD